MPNVLPSDSDTAVEIGTNGHSDEVAVTVTDFETPIAGGVRTEGTYEISEFPDEDLLGYPRFPVPWRQPWAAVKWIARTGFSMLALIALLAVIAAVPFASVFVLGYLLEVEGRVARTGKLRFGFPLLHRGHRIGTIAVGIGLWLLPVVFVGGKAYDAMLIDKASSAAAGWQVAKFVTVFLVASHLCLALARGGGFGCFLRPIKNLRWFLAELRHRPVKRRVRCGGCGEPLRLASEVCPVCGRVRSQSDTVTDEPRDYSMTYWQRADRKVRSFIADFRVKHHFLLGCRGFVGALAILIVPTLMFAAANAAQPLPIVATVFGGLCLVIVFQYVPFLQANLAAKNRLSAMWQLREIRTLFCYAPIAWFIALLLVYALALPLWLFTAFALPGDAMWLITLIFVASIYPARVLTGWAFHRAVRKRNAGKGIAWFGFRWGSRILMLVATSAFTLFFFFSRDISRLGRLQLFEHHTFLGTVLSSLFSLLP